MGACGRTGPGPSCTQTSRHHARLRNGNARVHTPQLGTQPGQLHRDGWTGDAVLQQAPMGAAWEVENTGRSAVSAVRVRDKSTIGGFASDGHGTQKMHL